MRLRFFSFAGTRCLDGLQCDLPRKEPDLVVLHGAFGHGKTTALDTIAAAKESIAEYGPPDARWDSLPHSRTEAAKIRLDWELSSTEQQLAGSSEALLSAEVILGKAFADPEHPKLLRALLAAPGGAQQGSVHYFHDHRELVGPLSFSAADAARTERLTTRNTKFSDFYDLLDQSSAAAACRLAGERLTELFPHLELVGLRRTGVSFAPSLRDRRTGAERSYGSLTPSEKQGFLAALYTSKSPIVDSVFLLDSPENGFGDQGAVELVEALLRWTTSTQLIVATSSGFVRDMPETTHVVNLP